MHLPVLGYTATTSQNEREIVGLNKRWKRGRQDRAFSSITAENQQSAFKTAGMAGNKLMAIFQGRHFVAVSKSDGLRVACCLVRRLYALRANLNE